MSGSRNFTATSERWNTGAQMATPGLQEKGDTVLVAGATGGVGQLVTANLLEVNIEQLVMLLK